MEEELTIREVCGHPFPPFIEWCMHLMGVHLSRRKASLRLRIGRWVVGLTGLSCILLNAWAVITTMPGILEEGLYDQVGLQIVWLVICSSGTMKYFVPLLYGESIIRIGEFRLRNRKEGRGGASRLERLIKGNCLVFFYGIMFVGLCWSEFPVLADLLPAAPPGIMGMLGCAPLEWLTRFACIYFVLLSVGFIASTSMMSMAFLIAQLEDLREEVLAVREAAFGPDLARIVQRHNQIIRLYNDISVVFSGVFTYQIIIATLLSACVIFSLHFNTQFNQALSYNLPLGVCSTIEFGLYCKLGEEISHGFSELHRAIYETSWYKQNPRDQTSVLIIQEMAKKEFPMLGSKVFIANLHTFVQVFQNAFSYYVIMKTMLAKSEE